MANPKLAAFDLPPVAAPLPAPAKPAARVEEEVADVEASREEPAQDSQQPEAARDDAEAPRRHLPHAARKRAAAPQKAKKVVLERRQLRTVLLPIEVNRWLRSQPASKSATAAAAIAAWPKAQRLQPREWPVGERAQAQLYFTSAEADFVMKLADAANMSFSAAVAGLLAEYGGL